ncbi:MAG: class I SAM-dependent methyltransferase [Phycisphaerales bacterium]|nr:class I SAM-dependent methyltransferase [Phycisphaerales bacterium]MCB9836073.1 class I SAM-dependent methyltransferase [Phycisphaera sp.]
MTTDFWNERYASNELVYGEAPNEFVALNANLIPNSGTALDIAAGEGRNALYLASFGLDVLAIDQSTVGLQKAERLAKERGLTLRTQAVDLNDFSAEPESFDVITSTFAHVPQAIRAKVHTGVRSWLKPGGVFLLEAYAPDQIHRDTGGPKDPALLAPLGTILQELDGLEIVHRASIVRDVIEGNFHSGQASVVQVVAKKRTT